MTMTVVSLALYLLGALMMMCLVEVEMRHLPSGGSKVAAIVVASVAWPLVMLYAVVGLCVDWTVILVRMIFGLLKKG